MLLYLNLIIKIDIESNAHHDLEFDSERVRPSWSDATPEWVPGLPGGLNYIY